MGIQEVAGYVFIVGGAVIAGRALPLLLRASRSGARLTAIPVGVWSDLLVGLFLLAEGVLDLCFPHGTWLDLIRKHSDLLGVRGLGSDCAARPERG
jgi:hypothetical protein